MPMIDLYAPLGTFADVHDVAARAATIVKTVEQVPDIPMFRNNTAAFVHELPPTAISDAADYDSAVRDAEIRRKSPIFSAGRQPGKCLRLYELARVSRAR